MAVTMANDQIRKIEAREKEIADIIAPLQKEADELATAKRVLLRLDADTRGGKSFRITSERPQVVNEGLPRPKDTPTNFEMVEFVLSSAEKEGRELTASEIVNEIRARYWPGLIGEQILPSIYGFAKQGRVRKTPTGKFKRIKRNDGPTGGTAEPSS